MITNPIAFGVEVSFALVTIAPKRPDFGEKMKDYIATTAGAFIAAVAAVIALSAPL